YEWQRQDERTFVGALDQRVRRVVLDAAPEILRRFPRILRRVSGYNLDVFAHAFQAGRPTTGNGPAARRSGLHSVGLHQLLVGSEGTLGVVLEAELNLVPTPRAVGLLIPQFDSLAA